MGSGAMLVAAGKAAAELPHSMGVLAVFSIDAMHKPEYAFGSDLGG